MTKKVKALPKGIQSFSTMIENNYIYIDKTKYMVHLIDEGRYYFLSRPRRFGKTLLVSTLDELFSGNRYLFKSLYIDSSDYEWKEHPVININFASLSAENPEALKKDLEYTLEVIAKKYDADISGAPSLQTKFKTLIIQLAKKNKVAVLIDEYDYAILRNITNLELADACRDVLKDLFSALKDAEVDKALRFIFITGITKFSRTSIFSGLNNLEDLSTDPRAAQLLGYTADEIASNFKPYLEKIIKTTGQSVEEIMEELKFWYNGYAFANPARSDVSRVYNPFSILLYLSSGVLDNYWFGTGTPTFLCNL